MKRSILVSILCLPTLWAKESFELSDIKRYLTQKNPYVYSAIGEFYIQKAAITTAQGGFDTKLAAHYNKKDYPISTGEFSDISLSKPFENGTKLLVGYRKAEGTQEYNNIKTSDDGEWRVGVNVSLLSFLKGINTQKYHLESARLKSSSARFSAYDNLRNLYSYIVVAYYELLYHHALLKLDRELLQKAQKRDRFIQKRVDLGELPEMALLESSQQIISRKQRVLTQKNLYTKALHGFVKYLNISLKAFEKHYTLPSLSCAKPKHYILEKLVQKALRNRADFAVLAYQKKHIKLEDAYNELEAYPKVDLFVYGVHDLYYGDGVKVGANVEFPIERRGYEGKKAALLRRVDYLEERYNQLKRELKANLGYLIASLQHLDSNIALGKQEKKIVLELEEAENQKYALGSSNLFEINQREIASLEVEQKQLSYYFNALLLSQEIQKETGGIDLKILKP